ncbi:palmitoyltransferase Hip14-like isoform X2 [Lolium rigidum]|uniref:palmitoyltransferase Hip14-like isoform X2 n=1 Tax=Lolium rigidum TaxID=89674 RepID=UPI001F5DA3B0|nr:palmitoyltransferase Hip14-like isoform X2 [Lolium rigidum]
MSRLASELHRLRRSPWEVLWSALVSCGLVLFSQLAVAIVPRLLPSISLLAMLPVAGLVFLATIVVGRLWRRFIGVGASAPLFVLFNVLFLWGVYIFVIRRDTSSLLDMLINAECALLLWGLYRILSGDPGIVAYESSFLEEAGCKDFVDAICSSEKHPSLSRVRQCNCCKANVRGYDHHCPAFGNCIGQKNHRLFMALLTGFVVAESTYTMCSTKYISRCINSGTIRTENPLSLNMVIGAMLFSVLQVLWQVVFLIWHVYGICFNIKTDEWINWKKYPEFQMKEQPQTDCGVKFVNPYDKGMLCNIREFLKPK